jgi:hypothetical protein
MIDNQNIELAANETNASQQLMWKGAVLLLCLGLFSLVMWSGARESATAEKCANVDQAAREACMANLRGSAPPPPAKGGQRPKSAAVTLLTTRPDTCASDHAAVAG